MGVSELVAPPTPLARPASPMPAVAPKGGLLRGGRAPCGFMAAAAADKCMKPMSLLSPGAGKAWLKPGGRLFSLLSMLGAGAGGSSNGFLPSRWPGVSPGAGRPPTEDDPSFSIKSASALEDSFQGSKPVGKRDSVAVLHREQHRNKTTHLSRLQLGCLKVH